MHWCLVTVAAAVSVAVTLRYLIRKITSNDLIITYVDEYVGNLCCGVSIMEIGVIISMYGVDSILVLLAAFTNMFLFFTYLGRNNLYSSPIAFVGLFYKAGREITFSLFFMATILLTSIFGLYSGQKFALFIWAFEDHSHIDAIQVACTSAMSTAHPWTYGFLAEASGIFICVCTGAIVPEKLKAAAGAFVSVVLIALFGHISGMMLHPGIATMFTFRCIGQRSDWEHILVYWCGPIVGCVAACELLMTIDSYRKKKIE